MPLAVCAGRNGCDPILDPRYLILVQNRYVTEFNVTELLRPRTFNFQNLTLQNFTLQNSYVTDFLRFRIFRHIF